MINSKLNQFDIITNFLKKSNLDYMIINHASEGKSEDVASIRGTAVGQGAKALVCKIKGIHIPQYLLAVLPGDKQLDFKNLASSFGVKKISLATIEEVSHLTGCVPGAVPPFSFHENLKVIADPSLFERFDEIAFNAGSLEASIKLNSKDYLALVSPLLLNIVKS